MKLQFSLASIVLVGCSVISSNAFVARNVAASKASTTSLFANSANIRAAMEATEKYGPTSPEARLAWEVVEEFDGRDNSAAFEQGNQVMSDEELAQRTAEFQANLETVQRLTQDWKLHESHMKDVAAEVQAIKLQPPERQPAPNSEKLWRAKLNAKALSEEYGNDSPEARLAWEEVEEIASAGLDNAMGEIMTEECLVEAAEACVALEELDRFINYERMNEGGVGNA